MAAIPKTIQEKEGRKNAMKKEKMQNVKENFKKWEKESKKKENEKRKRKILPAAVPLDPTLTSMFVKLLQPSGLIKITTWETLKKYLFLIPLQAVVFYVRK